MERNEKTAYVVLKEVFGFVGERVPEYHEIPEHVLFLDWEHAKQMSLGNTLLNEEQLWQLMFTVGVVNNRILPLADVAIQPLVSRLFDLGIWTSSTCSGHPQKLSPFMGLVFPEKKRGKNFLQTCTDVFHLSEFKMGHNDDSVVLPDRHIVAVWRSHDEGSDLPPKWFTERYFSHRLDLWWRAASSEDLQHIWLLFSHVLDVFDGKGTYAPPLALLNEHDDADSAHHLLHEVYESLIRNAETSLP